MIEVDGRSYTVKTATENAYDILTYVNQFMTDNNVKNKNGDIVQFKISLASPIWLLMLGIGYMATVCQKIMYAVANAFNIGSCSDQQVLNLAKVARLSRKQGSYTTIVCQVTASSTGTCTISTSNTAKATYENVEYTFSPIYDTTIAAGKTEEVILICSVTGPVYLKANEIQKFEETIDNFGSMTSSASQPGSNIETISELRTRLLNNSTASPIDGAMQALNALDGVTRAVILYNSNYDSSMIMAGFEIPPKKALVFVQGYSTKLAEEYYKYMAAQTVNSVGEGTAKATLRTMQYTLLNGQTLTFNYFAPVAVTIYVKVFVNELLTNEKIESIKSAITSLSNTRQIGENYTQAYILDSINANMDFPEINGCAVSVNNTDWSESTDFNEGNIGLITTDTVIIEEPVGE